MKTRSSNPTAIALLLLACLLIAMGCEKRSSSNLGSRSLYSTGTGTSTYGAYGTNTAMTGYGAYGTYGTNPYMYNQNMMTSTMNNPLYEKYLQEARQDRNDKFRQDMMMMLAMKGTEVISMMLMAKSMSSGVPMVSPSVTALPQQYLSSPQLVGSYPQTLASTAYIDPSLVSGGLTMSNPRYLTSAQSIACPTGDCYDYDVGVRGVRNQLIVR